jgi:hypothetical protein
LENGTKANGPNPLAACSHSSAQHCTGPGRPMASRPAATPAESCQASRSHAARGAWRPTTPVESARGAHATAGAAAALGGATALGGENRDHGDGSPAGTRRRDGAAVRCVDGARQRPAPAMSSAGTPATGRRRGGRLGRWLQATTALAVLRADDEDQQRRRRCGQAGRGRKAGCGSSLLRRWGRRCCGGGR